MKNSDRVLAQLREELASYAYRQNLTRIALTDNEALRDADKPWDDVPQDEREGFYKQADEQLAIIRASGLID